MAHTKVLLFSSIIYFASWVNACEITSCTPTPAHYDELGCRPVYDEEKCCAIRYECPERLTDAEGCQYRGKLYKVGESIKDQLLPRRCFEKCTCENWKDETTFKFACQGISQADRFQHKTENRLVKVLDKEINPSDHYPLERCEGFVVDDPDDLAALKKVKCIFEGDIFNKGETIHPPGTCYDCICDEKLKTQDLDLARKQCQRQQCGLGITGEEHDYLNRGCAPVYDSTKTTCCPIEWRCPEADDVVTRSGLVGGAKVTCIFGDFRLKLLDGVTYPGGDNLNCKCYIPPMMHCLKEK